MEITDKPLSMAISKPHCPVCGYTKEDASMWGDHHLCKGKIPRRKRTAPGSGGTASTTRLDAPMAFIDEKNGAASLVVHCKISPHDVYIGRPSVWGNPFSHKPGTLAQYQVGTPEDAISKYRAWLLSQPALVDRARRELRGKVLGCWCKTKTNPAAPCHGDVLVEIANE